MTNRTNSRFAVPHLKAKIRAVELLFGEKTMRQGLNPRTIDKWLNMDDPRPYVSSLQIYFGNIGLNPSDLLVPRPRFAAKLAELYARKSPTAQTRYSEEEIIELLSGVAGESEKSFEILSETRKLTPNGLLCNDFSLLQGCYHMYHSWKSTDARDKGKIRRNLLEIERLDEERAVMRGRLSISPVNRQGKEKWWIYEGWGVHVISQIFWLFECVKGMPPEVVSIHLHKPPFWPDPDELSLSGIVTALSLDGSPLAHNTLLIKIDPNCPYKNNLGYFSPKDIEKETDRDDFLSLL